MYPMYPNCFDMLTTHGIIAEDLVGYVTDTPSPYLQNYVAQRGFNPSLPGQVLPDPLPGVTPRYQPRSDIYEPVRPRPVITPHKKDRWGTFKKIAAAALLIGLGGFGIYKARKPIANFWKGLTTPPASGQKPWYTKAWDWVSKPFKTPPGQKAWYQKAWDWIKKPFTKTP